MPRKAAQRPSSSPRRPLSRERILQTAVKLADKRGLAAVTMRKLGEELGVEAMSLYNHIANKEELLDGMTDRVVAEFTLPTTDGADWKAAMRERAISAHHALLRHPWATMLIVSRLNAGPATLRYVEATLGCLRAAGFSYEMADYIWNAIDSYTYGFTLQAQNFPLEPSEYATAAATYLPQLPAETYPHLRELSQLVIDGSHSGVQEFTFGLDALLDGLERLKPPRRRRRRG